MAERRMFSKKITEADQFTELPPTTQALYFHLCMSADDDGFSNEIRKSMFNAHASTTDFNTLVDKRFIIPFDSGVIVIKHWKLHNYIQNDRYHETQFIDEKAKLLLKKNGVYTEKRAELPVDTDCIQDGYRMDTEVRLGKDSVGKNRQGKDSVGEDRRGKDNSCAKSTSEIDERFDRFWDVYPRHEKKKDARKAFGTLNVTDELLEQMLDAVRRQKASKQWQDAQYIPQPTTWLHGRRWEDEDIPQAKSSDGMDNLRNLYAQFEGQ